MKMIKRKTRGKEAIRIILALVFKQIEKEGLSWLFFVILVLICFFAFMRLLFPHMEAKSFT
jgi:hypothetical protein